MLKLYKQIDGKLHYWETWKEDEKLSCIHWGQVGESGMDKTGDNNTIQSELAISKQQGYAEFDEDEMAILIIEYNVVGMGTVQDVDKRHLIENRMNETLGWTGLGHCDGGSIGSGTMEVCCFVVDFDIAKKIIEQDLSNTEYADYNRIYLESNLD